MGRWASFGQVTALTAAEGTIAILVPPYLHIQGYDFSTIGLLVAVLGIMALASRLPIGIVYRPERGRAIMIASLLVLALSSALYPLANGPLLFGLVRAVNGLAIGVATTANLAVYMDTIPEGGDKARAMGAYGGAMAAGYMIGNFSGGIAADVLGYIPAFVLAGLFALLALGLLSQERPRPVPKPRAPHRAEAVPRPLESRLASAMRPLKAMSEPRVAALALIAFMLNFFHQVGTTFFPLYGVAIGLSLTEIGIVRSVQSMTNAVARPVAGPPVSRFGHQRVSLVGIAVLAVAFALMPSLRPLLALLALFVIVGLMRAVVLVANTTGIASIEETRMSRGLAAGLYNGSKDLGNLTSPIVCGTVASLVGLTTMLTLVPPLAALSFFGLVAYLQRQIRREASVKIGQIPSDKGSEHRTA